VADDPVGVLVGQPGQTGMRGAQIMPGVPLRGAERHGQECGPLRHLSIHADIVEIRCQKRVGQNLAVERSAAAMIAGAPPKRSKRLI
jgi:hypothetical protein